MKIYLAARYSRRQELLGYAAQLEELGHSVTSRWLAGNHQIRDDQLNDGLDELALAQRYAREDLVDVAQADLVISFTEEARSTTSRGGRHTEYGFALALRKRLWLIGPRENVFHCAADGIFADWTGALKALLLLDELGLEPTDAFRAPPRREAGAHG